MKRFERADFFVFTLAVLLPMAGGWGCATTKKEKSAPSACRPAVNWDDPKLWDKQVEQRSSLDVSEAPASEGGGLALKYSLPMSGGWTVLAHKLDRFPGADTPMVFQLKATGPADLEVKWISADGSVFGRRVPLKNYPNTTPIVLFRNNLEYWWGGKGEDDVPVSVEFAISGTGSGTAVLSQIGFGVPGLEPTFPPAGPVLDPDRELKGFGFRQRRDDRLAPEDPGVLEWLKQLQDASSPDKKLLPSMEDNAVNLFNQALVAMAFIVKGERERAERILDYYAGAVDRGNRDPMKQNFFLNGEARGFYQNTVLNGSGSTPACSRAGKSDRWVGDMAWLLLAYRYYEKTYSSDRYAEITRLLKDLIVSWFKETPEGGGYVGHGWREGDARLHETFGHPEGNIDCYAALKLCGETEKAGKIRRWLDSVLRGDQLPLDLYTWRALAYGKEAGAVLNIPEYDLRFRKTLTVDDEPVAGLFSSANIEVDNIWLDGTGHIACAFMHSGNPERGYFYANQLDAFLMDREIGGVACRALPYTANRQGGYDWVRPDRGFVSVGAWYIFAKNGFNPMTLEKAF